MSIDGDVWPGSPYEEHLRGPEHAAEIRTAIIEHALVQIAEEELGLDGAAEMMVLLHSRDDDPEAYNGHD